MKKLSTNYGQHLKIVKLLGQDESSQKNNSQNTLHTSIGTFDKEGFNLCQVLGNVSNSFIVCCYKQMIFLVDQHAASEKSLYIRFLKQRNLLLQSYKGEPFKVQNIYREVLLENVQKLKNLGWAYEILAYGPVFTQIKLTCVPSIFDRKCKQQQFIEILQSYYQKSLQELSKSQKQTMASFACHNAYRFGDRLSDTDMRQLLDTLYEMQGAFNCPHNRPIIIGIGNAQKLKRSICRREYTLS